MYHLLEAQLAVGRSVVVEGTFTRGEATRDFAAVAQRSPFKALQVFCTASDEVVLARYAERASSRHPGHLGGAAVDDVRAGLRVGRWARLELPGELLTVETTSFESFDLDFVLAAAELHVSRVSGPAPAAPPRDTRRPLPALD